MKGESLQAMAVSGNAEVLFAASGESVRAFDLSGEDEPSLRATWEGGEVSSLASNADGTAVLAGGPKSFRMWKSGRSDFVWEIEHELSSKEYRPAAWSGNSDVLAVALTDFSVSLVDHNSGEVMVRLEHPSRHRIWDVAISPDGKHVAVLTSGHLVNVWHLEKLAHRLKEGGFSPEFILKDR